MAMLVRFLQLANAYSPIAVKVLGSETLFMPMPLNTKVSIEMMPSGMTMSAVIASCMSYGMSN